MAKTTNKNLLIIIAIALLAVQTSDATLNELIDEVKHALEPVIKILDATARDIGLKHPNVTSELVNAGTDLGTVIAAGKLDFKSIKRAVVDLNNVLKAIDDGLDNLGPVKNIPPFTVVTTVVSTARVAATAALTILNIVLKIFDKA